MKKNYNKDSSNQGSWSFYASPYQVAEPCTYPNCDGIKLPDGTGWRCSKGGRFHYFSVKAEHIKSLQKRNAAIPLDSFPPIYRYWQSIFRSGGLVTGGCAPIFMDKDDPRAKDDVEQKRLP